MKNHEKEAPHDLEMEKAILGGIILGEDALYTVVDIVAPKDFYRNEHRIIYETMLKLVEENQPVDAVSVSGRLRRDGNSEAAGGATYISNLMDSPADVANVKHYAREVRNFAVRRDLLDFGRRCQAAAVADGPIDDAIEKAAEELILLSERQADGGPVAVVEPSRVVVEDYRAILEGNIDAVGIRTGFQQLDNLVLMRNGRVAIVAGATSSGKSSLAMQIARQVALAGKTVAFFSLEMSAEELATRILAAETGRDSKLIERGPATEVVLEELEGAVKRLEGTNLFIDDSALLSPFDVRAKARQIQMRYGLDLIVVDYLQLMTYRGRSRLSREQEVSALSRGTKLVAKSLSVPTILLSQLSRRHQEEGRKPELRDLRESGSIENDADIVEMIHRPDLTRNDAEILVRKQRQGPLGSISVSFDGKTQQFVETGYNPAGLDPGSSPGQDPSSRSTLPKDRGVEFDEGDSLGIDF